jgi:hypothetical protein
VKAGAISLYGPALGLPQPLSGHLSWQYWHPKQMPQRHAVVVGWWDRGAMDWLCASWTIVERVDNDIGLANEEQGAPISTCTMRRPLGELWDYGIARNNL